MANSKRKKTSGYFVTVGTGEKIHYNSNPTRSKPKVTETQKQAAEARVQQYRSAAKENASTQSGLSKPAKITSDVSGEAWTRATPSQTVIPEKTVTSQTKMPSGYTTSQRSELNRLQELRRQAQVDLDVDTMNKLDAQMKAIRAQAGKQTFGDRANDTLTAIMTGSAGQYANAVGFVNNAFKDPDHNRRQIARLQESLKTGVLSDGKPVTPAMRKTIQESIDRMTKEIEEWEAEDSTTNRIYRAADRLGEESAKATASAKEGLGSVGNTVVDAAVSLGQSTLDAVPALVTGGAAGMAPFVVRAFGGATQEARQKGADMEEQLLYGSAEAAKEYVTEKLFGLTLPQKMMGSAGAGGVDSIVENGIKNLTEKLAKTETGRKVLGGIATWFMSGVGEGAEEIIGSAIENAFINPNLRPWEPDTRTQQQKFEDALYDGLVGAVSGWLGGATNLATYDASKLSPARTTRSGTTVDVQNQNGYNESKVSPAASAQVQQTEAQAQVTRAENPGSTVLDAATTLFTQQGMKLKTAQEKAAIVQKLIAGEEVSVRDINKLNPTSKEGQAIFTQLTGVQFPEGKVTQEQLYNLYRSAHDVAVQAEAANEIPVDSAEGRETFPAFNRYLDENGQEIPSDQMSEEQILEQAKTVRGIANPEADARAAQALAQMRGEIAPDGNALLSFKEFSDFIKQQNPKATREETARLYDQYLKDNQTVEYRGQRLSHMQFMDMVRNAPTGSELTEAEAEDLWQREVKRQQDLNYNKEDSRNGQGQSAVYGAGLQGQSDQRSGMDAGGLYEGTGRTESESGTRGEYGTRSEGAEAVPGGHGEGSGGLLNNDAPVRPSTAADGRTVFNEVSETAWSEDMKGQTQKFSRVGIRLRAALDRIPIPGTNRYCDGVSHLGVESIVQSDSPFFTFEQLCDHEVGHQYFFRDRTSTHTNLYKRCVEAYKNATTPEQRQAMFTSYLGEYADVYAQADKKTRDQLRADIREEIICDAYAGMNRNGYGADQLQDVIKPIIDEWCAQRDAEMQTTEQKYSIDSMAEAVGLTFEKDGQVTVFKDSKGNAVDEVTEDHIRKSPLGAVIQSAVDANLITKEQAGKQVKFFSDLYNLMLKTQDIDLLWAVSSSIGFQPLESGPRDPATVNQKSRFAGYTNNADPQYSTTVDFTTICVKTQAIIDAMSETMMRLGRGLTEDEIVNVVYKNTHEAGEPVPCPVCYVFSRWVGLGGLFEKMNLLQTQYENVDEAVLRRDIDELEGRIYDIMVERGYAIKYEKKSGKPKLNGAARDAMYKEMSNRKNELTAKKNLESLTGKKEMTAAERSELEKLNKQLDILDNWTWLRDVRLSENYEPVPPEILYNINAGKEFAEKYPESWKFRTTRGPAMGKAATPYADEHLGQILRGAGVSDVNKADLGDPSKNPFLKGKDGELTKTAKTKLNTSRKKIKAQNLLNGQRYQSTSDFRFEYALDYLLSFVEMQALGGKVQLYTKVAESVPMFASVKGEVNCSLMPLGIGYRVNPDGSKTLVFSSVTGMNAEDAFNLSAKYDNVQPIMVGVNNEHIRLCMADDRITFIIPYHASGASEGRYVALMKVVGESVEDRTDYSEYQGDHVKSNATPAQKAAFDLRSRILTGKVGMLSESDRAVLKNNDRLHELYKRFYGMDLDGNPSPIDPRYLRPDLRASGDVYRDPECFGVTFPIKKGKVEIPVMPFEYWDRTSTIDTADAQGEAFIEYCESLGLHPRFSGWDSHGVYHPDMDLSNTPGYWKFLGDRALYNNDGTYHEQQAIDVTNFKADYLFRDKAIKGIVQPSTVNDPGKTAEIVEKSVAEIQAREGVKKYSIAKIRGLMTEDSVKGKTDAEISDMVEKSDIGKKFSLLNADEIPKKVVIAYKAFYAHNGQLYPPMVANLTDADKKKAVSNAVSGTLKSNDTPVGLFLGADIGQIGRYKSDATQFDVAFQSFWSGKSKAVQDLKAELKKTGLNPNGAEYKQMARELAVKYKPELASYSKTELHHKKGDVVRNESKRLAVENDKGSGTLAFRPGWHLGLWPDAKQFNKNSAKYGPKSVMPDGLVFAKCIVAADVDYQLDAMELGMTEKGSFDRTQAGLPRIPVGGYYKYRTNADPTTAPWLITGSMAVLEIMDDDMTEAICQQYGVTRSPRESDQKIDLAKYGLKAGAVNDWAASVLDAIRDYKPGETIDFEGLGLKAPAPTADQIAQYSKSQAQIDNETLLQQLLDEVPEAYVPRKLNFDDEEIQKEFARNKQDVEYYREQYLNRGGKKYSITGENNAMENEKAIRKLENEIGDINSKLDLASVDGLSETEIRRLRNQLTKNQYELDQRNAAERKAAVRTPLQTVLDNLDNYRAIDLESIANQLTDNAWDDVETLSTEELKSGIREILQERAGDMSPLELQSPKFGVYVRKPSTSAGVRYSVIDSDYMAAVERGDMETAQEMVDEAAKKAGYNSPVLYHGSPSFGFTQIYTKKSNDHISFFATDSMQTAGTYSGTSTVRNIGDTSESSLGMYQFYANTDGMVEFDAKGAESNHIALGQAEKDYNDFVYGSSWYSFATAKQLAKYAKQKGYTGVIIKNVVDAANPQSRKTLSPANVYIFFSPQSQLKSADPVTYDDNGNVIPLSERFQTTSPDIRYSITPEFEQWYKENFGGEDLTDAQLQRRLEYAKQKEADVKSSQQAAKTKQDVDQRYKDLTAWMMYHERKMREQRQTLKDRSKAVQQSLKADKKDALQKQAEIHKAELAVARDEKVKALKDQDLAWHIYSQQQARNAAADKAEALKTARKEANAEKAEAVRTTKDVERAKAEVQHDADMMAMKREAAKRLRIKEDAYQQKAEQRKENQKLKRNAAKQALRDSKLAAKKRAEAEVKQGAVDTIRKNPASRSAVERLQERASQLRTLGRSAYRTFVNQAMDIDQFAKRQIEGTRASTLVTVLGGANDTVATIYKNGLVDRAGNTIGESMKDVFLCWDIKGKKVDQKKQALLQDYMLHQHNVDRMSFVDRARTRLETFEQENPWLSQMDTKEFARLVAMTDAEIQSTGKQEAHDKAVQYARLLHEYDTAQNKPIFGDSDGNAVTADTSREIVQQYLAENPWLEEKAQAIYDWWDKFMRTWAVGDSITETEYNTMRELYPHYVPTYRADKKGVGAANFVGANGASIGKAVKKAKGGMSEVLNIEDSFSNLVSKIVRLERTNELYMNMIDSAMLDNDDTFSDMIVFDWDWQDGQYGKTLEIGAILNGDLDARYDDTEAAGLSKVGQDRKLTAWHNGRQYSAYVSEDLFKSIANVTGTVANDIEKASIKAGNALTGPMKTAITGINPFFAVRNLSRDLPTAITNSISGMAFPKYWAQAAAEIAKNSENWQHFQALGGTNATYYNDQNGFVNGMEKGDGIASKLVGKMGAFNEVTEAQTRFAEYLATIDRLGDTYENRLLGIKNAAEVTVDFSRKGRAGKLINAWVPYWNPAVQGVDKVVRSVIDSPDGSAVWKQAARTVGRASMTTVLLEAILYAVLKGIGRYDDWEELDDRTKDTYYCIPYGKSNTFIKVPKNREWGAILGTPFMRLLEYANGRENPFENYIETSLEPNFLPGQIFAPREGGGWQSDVIGLSQVLDLQANKDFAGRTIAPYSLEKGSKELQYNEDTSWFAKQLGALIHFSPMQIDYIITDYFGNFGDIAVMATSDSIINGTESLPEKFEDVVKNQFVVDNRKSNYVVSKYYDTLEQLDTVVQDRLNQLGSDAYKDTVEYQTKTAMDKLFGKQISELNKQVREDKTDDERMELKGQIAELAEQALSYYDDCMSGKVQNPVLDAQYASLPSTVAKELERLDGYSTDYRFKPAGTPSKTYTDPKNKNKEYVLTDEQKDKFKDIYQEQYAQTFAKVIGSSKYKSASDEKKANLLENARDDVLEDTKDEFFKWLKKTGAKSTAKKK